MKKKKGTGGGGGGGGVVEDYPKQPVLSPIAKETMPAQNKAERGKRKAKEKDSSKFELFSLLT